MRTAAGVSLLLAGALGACSSGDEPAAPTATLGTAPPVTPTTDPYAVPAVIDEAYVNRVLQGLDAAVGDVVRMVVRERAIPPEVLDRLDTLYLGEVLQNNRDVLAADLQTGFTNVKPNPGNQRTTVSQLITAEPDCIFAQVRRDYSAVVLRTNPKLDTQWVALRPLESSRDPNNYNPTPWLYTYDGFQPDGSGPPNLCIGR